MDFKKYADNLGLEESDFKELTILFVETTRADIQKLTNAIESKNFKHAEEASHSIKGASGNLGFMDIWKVATICEKASETQDLQEIIAQTKEIEAMINILAQAI